MIKSNKSGQMMIEALFALTVVLVVLITLASGAVMAIRNVRLSQNLILGSQYAQEGIEFARKERDSRTWEEFETDFIGNNWGLAKDNTWSDPAPCKDPTSPPVTSNIDNTDSLGNIYSRFLRCVNFEVDPDPTIEDRAKITATVYWTDDNCDPGEYCRQAEVTTYLTKWSK